MGRRGLVAALMICALAALTMPVQSAPRYAAQDPDGVAWNNLPYLFNPWFRVWTNEDKFSNGKRVTNAFPVTKTDEQGNRSREDNSSEFQVLEPKTCSPHYGQTWRMVRHIYLPGHATRLQASLGAYSDESKKHPVDSVALRINGQTVGKVLATEGHPIPYQDSKRKVLDLDPSATTYGSNKIEVVAHKVRTAKRFGFCRYRRFGALAELVGDFRADASVSSASTGETTTSVDVVDTVTNAGPSHLIPGQQYSLFAYSKYKTLTGVTVAESDAYSCDVAPYSTFDQGDGYRVFCEMPHLAPSSSALVHLTITWTEPYDCPNEAGKDININSAVVGYGETTETNKNNLTTNKVYC